MLASLILIPVLGSLCLIPITENSLESRNKMKKIALTTSLITFLISLILFLNFDSSSTSFQFVYSFKQLSFCDLNIGVDGISLYFVLLTTFITPIAILSNFINIDTNLKAYLISFLLLESLQILTFVSLDLFLFYIFFESVLPILFIIIIVFGSGKNKKRSALLLFLYTLVGSLPMLLSILSIQSVVGSTDFALLSLIDISLEAQRFLWVGFFIAFAIKTPVWPLSRWLALAHSDSPLAGSIILAGTILKLASYGMVRILLTFLPDATNFFSPIVLCIAIITLIYASLVTVIQQDTKTLIAYSSICHMALGILGICSNDIVGIEGAILLSVAHGIVSPALFICVGGILYDRTGTRLIKYFKGIVLYMPIFTMLFFVFSLANMATPLTLNFVAEQMSLLGIWSTNPIIAILGGSGIVLSACFTILFYNRISYGEFSKHLKPMKDISRIEFISLITLLVPLVALGIYPNFILENLHLSVTNILFTFSPDWGQLFDSSLLNINYILQFIFNINYSNWTFVLLPLIFIAVIAIIAAILYLVIITLREFPNKHLSLFNIAYGICIFIIVFLIWDILLLVRKSLIISNTYFKSIFSFLFNCLKFSYNIFYNIINLNRVSPNSNLIYVLFLLIGLISSVLIRFNLFSLMFIMGDENLFIFIFIIIFGTLYSGFLIFNFIVRIQNSYNLWFIFRKLLQKFKSNLSNGSSSRVSYNNIMAKFIFNYIYLLFISWATFYIIYATFASIINNSLLTIANSYSIMYLIYFKFFYFGCLGLAVFSAIIFLINKKDRDTYDLTNKIYFNLNFNLGISYIIGVQFLAMLVSSLEILAIGFRFCPSFFLLGNDSDPKIVEPASAVQPAQPSVLALRRIPKSTNLALIFNPPLANVPAAPQLAGPVGQPVAVQAVALPITIAQPVQAATIPVAPVAPVATIPVATVAPVQLSLPLAGGSNNPGSSVSSDSTVGDTSSFDDFDDLSSSFSSDSTVRGGNTSERANN